MSELTGPTPILPPAPDFVALGFGQVLERIYRLLKENLRTYVAIAVVPLGVMVVFYSLMLVGLFTLLPGLTTKGAPPPTPAALGSLMSIFALGTIPILMICSLYEAALSYAALRLNAGAPATAHDAWQMAWDKMGRYLGLAALRMVIALSPLLIFVLLMGLGAGAYFMFIHAHPQNTGTILPLFPLLMLLYLAVLVCVVLLMLWLSFSYPASLNENLTAWQAVQRSWRLTRGVRGWIFLATLVIYAISYAVFLIFELLLCALVLLGVVIASTMPLPQFLGFVALGVAAIVLLAALFLFMALTMGAYITAFSIYYQDQLRREAWKAALD
jgi:hypothetical protein